MVLAINRLLVCLLLSSQIAKGCLRMKVTACLPAYACTRPTKANVGSCKAIVNSFCTEPVTCPDLMCRSGKFFAGSMGKEVSATSVECSASTKLWTVVPEDGADNLLLSSVSVACVN